VRYLSVLWKRNYGITFDERQTLSDKQNHRCAICGTPEAELRSRLNIDHCHKTKVVRGLLCGSCNQAIGFFKSDPQRCLKGAEYLTGHAELMRED
jgi:hypothetical protein